MEQENKKAADNAMFKKLEEISIKMPTDHVLYKQDVESYKELFKIQFEKVQGETMKKNQRFGQLLIFLAKSVRFFPQILGFIPTTTMSLMNELGKNLHQYIRKKCVSAIMILRAKNILYPITTIEFFLKQFNIEDKELRKILYKYIINDIRRMNKHHQNNKINQQLKKFISQYITKFSDKTAQKSLQLMIEMYKRNIWTDNRTVNIVAEGCFNASVKIRLIACFFLISTTEDLQEIEESDSENQCVDPSQIKWKKGVRRHTKNKEKKLQKEKRRAERRLRKKQIVARKTNFMPIDLIYNPQEFAQKLFNLMNQKNVKFIHKLLYMSLVARIIWRHKLIMLPFYGALQKYMDPRQKQGPKVLAYFAESIHDVVPEDQIEPIVKHIIETFVNDKCSQFAMTVGLNTIRQIYSKCPSLITQEAMLYLCTYYEYKNRNVSTAAKSVINLVREMNPYLLPKKFRGNHANSEPLDIMKHMVDSRIKGAQLLGQDGDVPAEMNRIFTDQDFKKIRKLIRKREEDEDYGQNEDESQEQLEINSDEFVEVNQDEGAEGDEESELSSEGEQDENDEDLEQIDWENAEQVEEDGDQQEQDQNDEDEEIDEKQDDSDQGDGQDQEQLQWNSEDIEEEFQEEDQAPKKSAKKTKPIHKQDKKQLPATKNNKKRTQKQKALESDSDDDEQSQQVNPHGFVDLHRIAFYKKSKTQIKADRRRNPQEKQKFKHQPKDKKGGKTNEQSQKNKPIMMLRAKKNKLKLRQKQVKIRIKSLKNQLGKVRSTKEAKKMKNKKIKKP